MSTMRRAATSLGALALLTPAVLALSAGTASAAGIASPADGTTYSTRTSVSVSASFAGCASLATSCPSGTLTVTDPAGASAGSTSKTASRGTSSTTLSLSVDTGDGSTRPNGAWTVTLKSGSSTTTSHYFTNLAPATPGAFTVSTTDGDPNDVFLSWNKGSEPDLQSYRLYDGNGNLLSGGITPSSACSGSSCNLALYYDNPKPGSYDYSYKLTALRSGGCSSGSCAPVESAPTATKSATLTTAAPPPPSPTPGPTPAGGSSTGGSTSGGSTSGGSTSGGSTSGGSTSGGSTSGGSSTSGGTKGNASPIPLPTLDPGIQKRALALNFSNFSASLGIPKLPPLPSTTVTLPGSQPIPNGTYDPQLPYKAATETTRSGGGLSSFTRVTSVDWSNAITPIAFALILVLTAAHLRRWIGAHAED